MRLSPDQDWEKIVTIFEQHFKAIAPAEGESRGILITEETYVTPIETIGYKAAHQAYLETFGIAPITKKRRRKHSNCPYV